MNIDGGVCDTPPVDVLTDLLTMRARAVAVAQAALLEAVVAVADRDPVGFDTDLVAFSLAWTRTTARLQVEFGRYLQQVLKPVWHALCAGDVDVARAHVFHDILAPVDNELAVAIAAEYVSRAGQWTTSQLRDRLRRAVLRGDPAGAATRTERTIEQRHVSLVPEEHSTASLFAVNLPAARAVAAFERVDAYARARHQRGDARTLDQLRADTVLDLLEGVDIGTSPIHRRGILELTIPWSTLARGGDEPAMLSGYGPIEAPLARELATDLLDRTDIACRYRITGTNGQLHQLGSLPSPRNQRQLTGLLDHI